MSYKLRVKELQVNHSPYIVVSLSVESSGDSSEPANLSANTGGLRDAINTVARDVA